jgi:hypothetical protein
MLYAHTEAFETHTHPISQLLCMTKARRCLFPPLARASFRRSVIFILVLNLCSLCNVVIGVIRYICSCKVCRRPELCISNITCRIMRPDRNRSMYKVATHKEQDISNVRRDTCFKRPTFCAKTCNVIFGQFIKFIVARKDTREKMLLTS